MLSEFDHYLNEEYVQLGSIGAFCLTCQRFVKSRTMKQASTDVLSDSEKVEKLASVTIEAGDMQILSSANQLDNQLESIMAKMDLYLTWPMDGRN